MAEQASVRVRVRTCGCAGIPGAEEEGEGDREAEEEPMEVEGGADEGIDTPIQGADDEGICR